MENPLGLSSKASGLPLVGTIFYILLLGEDGPTKVPLVCLCVCMLPETSNLGSFVV